MGPHLVSSVDMIAGTLLHVGDRVVELTDCLIICRVWDRDGLAMPWATDELVGRKLSDLDPHSVLAKCNEVALLAVGTRTSPKTNFEAEVGGVMTRVIARMISAHPEPGKTFLVIEVAPHEAGSDYAKRYDQDESPVGSMPSESEELSKFSYEKVLNNIAADIVVLDSEYRFRYVNPTAVRDADTRKWLIGKTDEEFFRHRDKPLSLAERRQRMYDAARNERQPIEWVERTETLLGGIKTTLRKIFPVFDRKGNLDILIGYAMNITDLMSAQEELRTTREMFESAFHDSGIGMALISADGQWLDVNRVMCELTGYTKDELKKVSFKDIAYPGEWEEDRELLKQVLRREIPGFTVERRYFSKQGKLIIVLLTISVVWNMDEQPVFFIAQAVDITTKKELEDVVTRKNEELETTKVKLLNKVNQLEELSYIIAHNLRGPAGNIKVLTEALLARINADDGQGPFTIQEGLEFIQEAGNSLMNSLSSLMQIAEIKLNKDVPRTNCDVASIIEDVVSQLQNVILEKRARIRLALEVDTILYPKAYLESIIYNLVSNAIKYSKPDVLPEILISTSVANGRIQLSVRDNGLGIDLDKYGARVFKLNQVFHAGADSKGVGLYLIKTQIEALGGTISVISKLNEGCEFVVTI